jgi:hypothetical protein
MARISRAISLPFVFFVAGASFATADARRKIATRDARLQVPQKVASTISCGSGGAA